MTAIDPMPTITDILYPQPTPATHRVRIWSHNGFTHAECECHQFAMQSLGTDQSSRRHVTWHSQVHGEIAR
jgi:Zn ribbon nucleic-acid-binding protein